MEYYENEQQHTILIVDDEPYVLRVLQMKLVNAGYSVVTAVNGRDGLEKFLEHRPTVIITDIRMPHMDGQELYELMHEQGGEAPFFVIMMTSTIDNAMQIWAGKRDNIHFVEKPLSPRNIISVVKQCISDMRGTQVDR